MMRKNIFYILATLFAFMIMGLSSCSDEQDIGAPGPDEGKRCVVTFRLAGTNDKPSTRATTDGPLVSVGALEREKTISRLDAVVFKSDVYFKTIEAVKIGEEGANYELDMKAEGTFDFYLLANAGAELLTGAAGVTTKEQFEELVAGQTPGEDYNATDFLMISAEKKGITTESGEPNNIGTVELTRLSARFDFYNMVPGLELTQIVFKNRYHQSKISRALSNSEEMSDLGKTDKVYAPAEGLTGAGLIGGIYGYEDYSDNATFELTANYNGNPVKHTLVLQQHSTIRNIRRNTLYSIVISPKGTVIDPGDVFGSLHFDITVNDWEEGGDIFFGGEGNLADAGAPDFTVIPADEATVITTDPAAVDDVPYTNPNTVTLTGSVAGSITVTVTSNTVGARLRPASDTLPAGYDLAGGSATVVDGKLQQTYTITVPAIASGETQSVDFVVENAVFPTSDSKRTFTLNHDATAPVNPDPVPKLSLEYVAETNMTQTDAGAYTFAANNANTNGTSGYYSWSDACTRFGNFTVDGTAYHLPAKNEWLGILPFSGNIYFDQSKSTSNVSEAITVENINASYLADYKSTGNNIAYALRFKQGTGEAETGYPAAADNSRRSAWRYEYVDNTFGGSGKMVKVSATHLGDDATTLNDILSADWWTNRPAGSVVVRYFPVSGINGSGTGATGSPSDLGSYGFYWSATENNSTSAWNIFLVSFNAGTHCNYDKTYGFTVRPFADK